MRRVYLALGDRLVERGVLVRPEDIFFLAFDEVRGATVDKDSPTLHGLIEKRRSEIARDAAIDPGDTLCGRSSESVVAPSAEDRVYLVGIRGSPGVARGAARVVTDPSLVNGPLTKADIIVVPFTDIGWTLLFPAVGGVVAETGGQLSHSSIIAREYGVPAVVSVRDATRIIRDGQTITVDGDRGRVYLDQGDTE
jgi:pyruvate,water dikinase